VAILEDKTAVVHSNNHPAQLGEVFWGVHITGDRAFVVVDFTNQVQEAKMLAGMLAPCKGCEFPRVGSLEELYHP
jgi:hypothetical protein